MSSLVLLSGGIDSAVCAAIANHESRVAMALCFDYGQRHQSEIRAAMSMSASMKIPLRILKVPMFLGSSAGDGRSPDFVVGRNLVFLSIGAACAESLGASSVYIGASREDHGGFPDCRRDFLEEANSAIKKSSSGKVSVEYPLVDKSKAEIILIGEDLGVRFDLTRSCYKDSFCGECGACVVRAKGFKEAGVTDPCIG